MRCRPSELLSCVAGVAVLGAALASPAQTPAEPLFQVPEGCGTEADYQEKLEELVGDAVAAAQPTALAITAAIEGGYELRLRLGDELRELRDRDCHTLFDSAVVIAAAAWRGAPGAITPGAITRGPAALPGDSKPIQATPAPTRRASAPARPPRAASTPPGARPRPPTLERVVAPQPNAVASTRATRREHVAGVSIGAGISGGVLPQVGAMLELGASLEPAPWGASFGLRYWPERGTARAGRDVDLTAMGGRAAGLVAFGSNARVSVGLEVNRLSGTGGEAVSRRDSAAAWHVASSFGLSAIPWNVGHLRLELVALGRVALIRPRFVVTGFGDVYRVPPFGADAILRGVWLFP